MSRISYVNGRYVPHANAVVHIEDRGYQFADGVYEVIAFYNRMLVDGDLHFKRFWRSMKELGITPPTTERALHIILQEVMRRNAIVHGSVYVQVTRGVAKRDHVFKSTIEPSLVVTILREKPVNAKEVTEGTEVVSRPDIRWLRRDIKSIALLPNALLKNEMAKLGKREAWLVDDKGFVTEGSVSNAFIITKNGTLVTRGLEVCVLPGVTRHRVLAVARELGIKVEERPFTLAEAKQAKEAFITSTTTHIVPVIKIDESSVGNGHPGLITQKLFTHYVNFIERETGRRIWQN